MANPEPKISFEEAARMAGPLAHFACSPEAWPLFVTWMQQRGQWEPADLRELLSDVHELTMPGCTEPIERM
jgi:hypothetical protein